MSVQATKDSATGVYTVVDIADAVRDTSQGIFDSVEDASQSLNEVWYNGVRRNVREERRARREQFGRRDIDELLDMLLPVALGRFSIGEVGGSPTPSLVKNYRNFKSVQKMESFPKLGSNLGGERHRFFFETPVIGEYLVTAQLRSFATTATARSNDPTVVFVISDQTADYVDISFRETVAVIQSSLQVLISVTQL